MCKYLLCSFLLICLSVINSQYLDDFCTIQNSGQSGKCLLLQNCPKAITDLQQNQIYPQQCGFQGTQPIVCCVQTTSKPTRAVTSSTPRIVTTARTSQNFQDATNNAGRISKQKCEEYSKYVFVEQSSAVLLANRRPVRIDKCASRAVELIVGGEKANPREFPHMALIGFDVDDKKEWKCGGTLISELFVLTAAHCLYTRQFNYAKYIRLGDLNIERTNDDAQPQDFEVAERFYHPSYAAPSSYHDIALLKLDRPATLNIYVRPACLSTENNIQNARAVATGWGNVGYSKGSSSDLLKVTLERFSYDRCKAAYRNVPLKLKNGILEDIQTCWGSQTEEKDTCQGDSGGPLQVGSKVYCMYDIIGVTSLGKGCGVVNVPAVYTKVANYVDWIESIVWGNQ